MPSFVFLLEKERLAHEMVLTILCFVLLGVCATMDGRT